MAEINLQVKADFKLLLQQIDEQINKINSTKKINIPVVTKGSKADSEIKSVGQAIDGVVNSMDKMTNTGKKTQKATEDLGRETKGTTKELMDFDEKVEDAVSKMVDATVKATLWAGAMGVLYGSLRLVKQGVSFIIELDKSLTEISIVTGKNREEVRGLSQEYNELARTMGQMTKDVTDASVAFFRQGKNVQQTMNLTRASLIGASIANIDLADSSEYLTSALNGFMWTSEQALDAIDKFAKVSSIAGTSFEELSIGFQKANASAYSAGMTFDELASYMAVVSEVTRESASSIGNSLKTIITRFGKIADLGKLEDEGITYSLNGIDDALKQIGMTLRDETTGQIKDLGDIIRELGGQWEHLDVNTRNAISFQIAGIRQMNRFIALMDNYGRSLEILYESITAQGTALQQYNAYMQGTEYQIKRLKAEFEGLTLAINGNGKMLQGVINYFADIITFFRVLTEEVTKSKDALVTFYLAGIALLAKMYLIAPQITVVTTAIVGLGYVLGKIGKHFSDSTDEAKKYADSQRDLVTFQKSSITSLEELDRRLTTMATTEEGIIKNKQELVMWYDALERIQPGILDGIDKEAGKYEDLKRVIEDLTKARKEDLAQTIENTKIEIEDLKSKIADIEDAYSDINVDDADWNIVGAYKAQQVELPKLKKALGELEKAYTAMTEVEQANPQITDDLLDKYKSSEKATKSYTSSLEDYFNILQKIANTQSELARLETYKTMVTDAEALHITELQIKMTNELLTLNKDLRTEQEKTRDSLIASLKPYDKVVKVSEDFSRLIVDTEAYNKLSDSQKEKIDNLVKSFDSLRSTMNSTNEEIIKLGQSLQKMLNENLKNLTDKILVDLQQKLDELYKQQDEALESINSSLEQSNSYYDELIAKKQKELDLYKKQVSEQERMLRLKKLEAEMEDVLNDKRFEIISGSGEKVLTYDRERYEELSQQRDDLIREYEQDDIKNALQAEIDALKEAKSQTATQRQEDITKLKSDIAKKVKLYENERDNIKAIQDGGISNLKTNIDGVRGLLDLDIANKESYVSRMYELATEMQSILQMFPGGSPVLPSLSDLKQQSSSASQLSSSEQIKADKQRVETELLNALAGDAQRVGYNLASGALTANPTESQLSARNYINSTYAGGLSAYVQSQLSRYRSIGVYHDGGLVGGLSFNPQTEEMAKLLKGEFVSSKSMLEQLPNTLGRLVADLSVKTSSSVSKGNINNFYGDIRPTDFNDFIRGVGFLTKAERGMA